MAGWELIGIAIGRGMDVLGVSMAVAAGPALPRQAFRLSWHFGLFQFLMPLGGWLIGRSVVGYVAAFDHWVAFGLNGGARQWTMVCWTSFPISITSCTSPAT